LSAHRAERQAQRYLLSVIQQQLATQATRHCQYDSWMD
jgi:hypothetical protein